MAKPKVLSSFNFHSGDSLFVFEPGQVRIFGEHGSEAAVPLEDIRALLEHLDENPTVPPNPAPTGLLPEDPD